jgi:hypothetical protein
MSALAWSIPGVDASASGRLRGRAARYRADRAKAAFPSWQSSDGPAQPVPQSGSGAVNLIAGAALAGFGHLEPQTVRGASPVASTSGTASG